jgi:hypothetical protein
MWLVLAAAVLACDGPSQEMTLRVVDQDGAVVAGAEVRKSTRPQGRESLLGLTDDSGALTFCVSPETDRLGVYSPGFRPKRLRARAGEAMVTLEAASPSHSVVARDTSCASGSTRDGAYRLCSDALGALPLRN